MITEKEGYILIDIHVIPRSSVNRMDLTGDGALKLKITAPPVDGEANEAVIKFLSAFLDVSKRSVRIEKGETSKNKRIRIDGVSKGKILESLSKQ